MGIIGNLKDLYRSIEGGYYSVLDKIDNVIPVYKIVDPIDRIVPSFLLLIFAIAVAGFLLLSPGIELPIMGNAVVVVSVQDLQGNPLQGVRVSYDFAGQRGSERTDSAGQISIQVPVGEGLELKVSETSVAGVDFKEYSKTVVISGSGTEKVVLERVIPLLSEKTLILQYASGERVKGREITVRLSCETGITPDPETVTDTDLDGMIVVTEPAGCGIMQATVIEPAEFAGTPYLLTKTTTMLRLAKPEVKAGAVRVTVKNEAGQWLEEINFEVNLLDGDGLPLKAKFTGIFGEVIFRDVVPGTYSVSVSDETNDYAIATVPGVRVVAEQTTVVNSVVNKGVKGVISVTAVESDSGQRIAEAAIRLLGSDGKLVAAKTTSPAGEPVEFAVSELDDYVLQAIHEDYLYGELDLEGEVDGDFEVSLEIMTPQNSGQVKVLVIDEHEIPVENARVKLRFLDDDFLAPYQPEVTNFDGIAEFGGVREGSYYAYVEKFPAFGDNKDQGQEIDVRGENNFMVILFVGETTVNVNAVDQDLEPVEEAEVEFYSVTGQLLGKIPLPRGTGSYPLKADKKVYLVVRHPDFQPVQTMPEQLFPGEELNFNVEFEPRLISGEPNITMLGMFLLDGTEAARMSAGQRYVAKFKLSVPDAGSYERGGVHFRTGNEAVMENDPLFIKEIIAGNINALLRGTTFNPPTGYQQDLENLTEGEAKWANFGWQNLEPGNYLFGVEIRVKDQITPNTPLPIHYRAWAETSGGDFIRAPFDAVLGTSESSAERQALYAKTYDSEPYEGEETGCENALCYGGQWIYSKEEGLYLIEPYELAINAEHTLSFSILNKSETYYADSRLYIESDGELLEINSYKIVDADAKTVSASGLKDYKIDGVGLGEFTRGKSVRASLEFTPRELGTDVFQIQIVADGRIVFSKAVETTISASKHMEISVDPEYIGSYSPATIVVNVKEIGESGAKLDLKDALVRVTRIAPDRSEVYWEKQTNSFGNAQFLLPGSHPNTVLKIEAEKPGFAAEEFVMTIDSEILEINPDSLQVNLDTRGQRETIKQVSIKNRTWNNLKIKDLRIKGRLKGMFDEETISAYLETWIGKELEALSTEDYPLFKIRVSENALDFIKRAGTVRGEFLLTVENPEILAEYDFVIPFKANIMLGGLPDNAPCITLSRKNWVAVTESNRATMEFEIYNNCVGSGQFLRLENLQARLNWESDVLGVVEIAITEAETGASNVAVMRPNVWSKFFGSVRPDATYYAIVTFTPRTGHLGEEAKFFIEIDGEIATDAGPEMVGSDPGRIESRVDIINLDTCITYPDVADKITIGSGNQARQIFTVNTELCGETQVDIYLCYQDPGCSGGTDEGYIQLSSDRFTIAPANPQKEIIVERGDIAGAYGISVFARMPGTSYRKVDEVLVEVEPRAGQYFAMDRYSFAIVGEGAMDSATLSNRKFHEPVSIKASICDWDKSLNNNEYLWKAGGIGAATGAISGTLAGVWAGTAVATAQAATATAAAATATASTAAGAGAAGAAAGATAAGATATGGAAAGATAAAGGATGGAAGGAGGTTVAAAAGGIGATGIGIIVAVVIIVAAIVISLLVATDPCDEMFTAPVTDYIINLHGSNYGRQKIPPDLLALYLRGYAENIDVKDSNVMRTVELGTERIGIIFTNKDGIGNIEPIYSVLHVEALEHIHGDSDHTDPFMELKTSNFGPYHVPDTGTVVYTQPFHVRFKTMNIPQVIPPVGETLSCLQGTTTGRSGKGALPKTKLDWSWSNAGIPADACDYGNPNGIYCDATQFSIATSKKIHMLDEFFRANEFEFPCPENLPEIGKESMMRGFNADSNNNEVETDTIGLEEISHTLVSNSSARINAVLYNDTESSQTAEVIISTKINVGGAYDESCSATATVGPKGRENVECDFEDLPQGTDFVVSTALITSGPKDHTSAVFVSTAFRNLPPSYSDSCWMPPVAGYYEKIFILKKFVESKPGLVWTNDITSFDDLEDITRFKVTLMKDAYPEDFRKDFAEFYMTSQFFDAPAWFADNPGGKLADYFLAEDESLVFSRKFVDDYSIPAPGVYETELMIAYDEDEPWRLYDSFGTPIAQIGVMFYRVQDAYPDSVFYYIPFNGNIGKDSENGRQGYGVNYNNADKDLVITSQGDFVTTEVIPKTGPATWVETKTEYDFKKINSSFANRGMIMKITQGDTLDSKKILFYPNYATPVLLRMQHERDSEPFQALYELLEAGTPVETGGNLAFWDGAGKCLDYSGVPVAEAFDYQTDRSGKKGDPVPNWEFLYGLDWDKADYGGDVYLKTVFYTPIDNAFSLKAVYPEELAFISPDSPIAGVVDLKGIDGMTYNSRTNQTSVNELREVLDLVESGQVCVTSNGIETSFWWNPKSIYETAGNYSSVMDIELGLVEGDSCIGYEG